MKAPKQLTHPELTDAVKLSPLDMNNIKFTGKHTLLTPEVLEAH